MDDRPLSDNILLTIIQVLNYAFKCVTVYTMAFTNSLYYGFYHFPKDRNSCYFVVFNCIEDKEEDCDGVVCRDSQPGVFVLIQLVSFVILHILPTS